MVEISRAWILSCGSDLAVGGTSARHHRINRKGEGDSADGPKKLFAARRPLFVDQRRHHGATEGCKKTKLREAIYGHRQSLKN